MIVFCRGLPYPLRASRLPIVKRSSFPSPILLLHLKAGACLVAVQVVVSEHKGFGIACLQFLHQQAQGLFLCLRACVGRPSGGIQSALVAYAYGMFVVPLAVCAWGVLRASFLYCAVPPHDIVVANPFPPQFPVPGIYLAGRRALPGPYARAMQDNKRYFPHILLVFACTPTYTMSCRRLWQWPSIL